MIKVITYGTFDMFHIGHQRLLERAKALGDYLIVGVTSEDFDKARGKINVKQSLMERIEAIKESGLADEVIVEEYDGQKIDDIKRYDIDIFTVGSDWVGKFDYLNEYCKVVYLDRTQGVSSSQKRTELRELKMGIISDNAIMNKVANESSFVNGLNINCVCTTSPQLLSQELKSCKVLNDYAKLLECVDAVYIASHPRMHYEQIKLALLKHKHVLCESPIALSSAECNELLELAIRQNCVLMDGIKTAYSTAFNRLILLAKSGQIGDVVSVDATCTSLRDINYNDSTSLQHVWSSLQSWGPTALLPVFALLGCHYSCSRIDSHIVNKDLHFDDFTRISFTYPKALATIYVGKGVKKEGELIISGTKGYIYVPAPWWKTDYFELRFENPEDNKRYFYQLEGEGIRYELVSFLSSIERSKFNNISREVSLCITQIMEDFEKEENLHYLKY